jgi:hypothetical protein
LVCWLNQRTNRRGRLDEVSRAVLLFARPTHSETD